MVPRRRRDGHLGVHDDDQELVRVDPSRQYLCGHSMGGYGAWRIARSSPETWAALGIHAGALGYDGGRELKRCSLRASGGAYVLRRRQLRRTFRGEPRD